MTDDEIRDKATRFYRCAMRKARTPSSAGCSRRPSAPAPTGRTPGQVWVHIKENFNERYDS